MKDESVLAPLLATWGLAEAGARTLSPREPPRPPLPVDLADYFTDEEIERGYRFARPQRALALAAHAVEIGLLGWLALRPPAVLRARRASPLVTAAATGASLTVVLSIPPLH